MADLIDRQEAIDAIDEVTWYHQNKNGEMVVGAGAEHEAWYKADKVLEALDKVPTATQWIPTQDRKPDLNQKVIWQFDYRDGHEYLIGSRNDVMLLADSAVAWMPLPEPYKGGNNGSARWEYVDYGGVGNWHCSACRAISHKRTNFCPACGRDMRGDYQ